MLEDTTYKELILITRAIMLITKDYINTHKTDKGAWTKDQIQALGIEWPPSNGWMRKIIGTELADENAARFELKQFAKGSPNIKISNASLKKADITALKQLAIRINKEIKLREA